MKQRTFDIAILFIAVFTLVFLSYAPSSPEEEHVHKRSTVTAAVTNTVHTPFILPVRERAVENEEEEEIIEEQKDEATTPIVSPRAVQYDAESPYPHVAAEAVLIHDITRNETLFERNRLTPRPIASITKLVTVAVALQHTNLFDHIHVSQFAIDTPGDAGGLRVDDVLSVDALVHAALLESSNDAAVALAEHVGAQMVGERGDAAVTHFVYRMNEFAQSIGMTRSYFSDPSGLEDMHSFSTADDVVRLVRHLRETPSHAHIWNVVGKPQETFYSQSEAFTYLFKNNNPLVTENPYVIGGKTGFTLRAGQSLTVLAESPDGTREIAFVILGSPDRFAEMRHLIQWVTRAALARQ